MKKWKLAFFAAIVSSLALNSCQKEEPQPTEEEDTAPVSVQLVESTFSASVEGVPFPYTLLSVDGQAGNLVSVVASNAQGYPLLNLAIPKSINVGTHSFGGQFGTIRGLFVIGDGVDFEYAAGNATGTLEITAHDKSLKVVRGTFSFTANPVSGSSATDNYDVSAGEFVIQY